MDAEPQYPVDSVTQNAMEASRAPGGGRISTRPLPTPFASERVGADRARERRGRRAPQGPRRHRQARRLPVRRRRWRRSRRTLRRPRRSGPDQKVRHAPTDQPAACAIRPYYSTRRGRIGSVPSRSRRLARLGSCPGPTVRPLFSLTPLSPLSFSASACTSATTARWWCTSTARTSSRSPTPGRFSSTRRGDRGHNVWRAVNEAAKQVRVQGDQEPR